MSVKDDSTRRAEEDDRRTGGLTVSASASDEHILAEAEKIAVALGRMFPGLCEVVLHDLRNPRHAIRAIENNLSGRQVGDSATELGLARIQDPNYPSVIQNYANQFPDGRPAKSTSIGIKNAAGEYIAALCLNLDVSTLSPVTLALSNLVATDPEHRDVPLESLRDRSRRELREVIETAAAERSTTPRSLSRDDKKDLVRRLYEDGYFDTRNAAQTIADLLGISRASVYTYTK
ncbi:helix-turn-helix transcriptional regulator [Streptomyces coffeae]|uniref:PAS domain-containing protein n=1 Tax=Streptomyces coffeae TaxID=621382 RepID=A0ABS1NN85_9ACTN|nr:PAS domain-containing protein [Streptomyces coffeae]MBL1101552.1 PAS domain-containing protein [Streptomyces coffeae]